MLKDKVILLGVTGGIASYKSIELAKTLSDQGATVKVVMTPAAMRFITPLTFRIMTRQPVATELFEDDPASKIHHISLSEEADLILVAPATANIIAKIATGVADDLLTTTILAARAPVLIAPAMNDKMYLNPLTRRNISRLSSLGFEFIGPEQGVLACGAVGPGRLASIDKIVEAVKFLLARSQDLKEKKILVTAGATREPIDPVRYISNRSSGKMGYEIARELIHRGAAVTLISGVASLDPPAQASIVYTETALQMRDEVKALFPSFDAIIMTAAVSDFMPTSMVKQKIKKDKDETTLTLKKCPDILSEIKEMKENRIVIAFSAETENLIENSKIKLEKKGADLIVCNDISRTEIGFESDDNEVTLIDKDGQTSLVELTSKRRVARAIIDRLVEMMNKNSINHG